jgi:hypothetical protein
MAAETTGEGGEIDGLVAQMQHLKQEHRALADLISGDPGMSASTRKALLEHLLEEEDELALRIAAATTHAPSAAGVNRPLHVAPRLTVGSLRADSAERSVTLGSLRRR